MYGQFDATLFPFRDWRRCALASLEARAVRRWAPDHMDRDHEALVEQVHARLLPARGIWVEREQILITSGAQQGLFLLAQLLFGWMWSGLLASGEWALGAAQPIVWGWPLALALAYIAVGPAILAYRCWGIGVQRVGPAVAGFFANLTPLFAALLSAAFLGEVPQPYHAAAFALIVSGIIVSSRR